MLSTRKHQLTIAILIGIHALAPRSGGAQDSRMPDSLVARIDSQLVRGLVRYQIAGAAIAIVERGTLRHARGFGLADVARRTRVDPERTRFHIASVTKLITSIAALQQVERGRLSLDSDVRSAVPEIHAVGWSDRPISLHQLLTHTAGLEPALIGIAAHAPREVGLLTTYLSRATPAILDAPPHGIRYSNFGFGIVGRIIETAASRPWAEVTERDVFTALGMDHAYAALRLPDSTDAVGYRYRRDTIPEPIVFERLAPAGSVRASVIDLARLMTAVLDTTPNATILTPASRRLLLSSREQAAPGVAGFAYGTFEYPSPGPAARSVGGEVPGFSTRILFIPRLGIGVAIVANRKDPLLALSVFDSLLARFPASDKDRSGGCAPAATSSPVIPVSAIAGDYRNISYDHHSFLHLGALLTPFLHLAPRGESALVVRDPAANRIDVWMSSGTNAWRSPDGRCLGAVNVGGRTMLALSTAQAGPVMLEPVPPLSKPLWTAVPFLSALLVSMIAAIVTLVRPVPDASRIRVATALLAGGHLIFAGGFLLGLARLAIIYDDRFAFGLPTSFRVVLALPYVLAVLTAWLGWLLVKRRRSGRTVLLAPILVAIGGATLCILAWGWSLPAL